MSIIADEGSKLDLGKKEDGSTFKFMVVDDSDFMVKNLVRVITSLGGEVLYQAVNGKQAVEMYEKVKGAVDVVTMDITMPEMNGLEALEKIRAFDAQSKVVMITALGHDDLVRQAILRGARHYIVKPFARDKVFEVLNKVTHAK